MLYVYVICVILLDFSGSGIGREIAIVLGRLGVRVVLWDVNKMGNEETRQIIQDRGGTAYAYLVDVSNTASVMSTAEKVLLEFFSTICTETCLRNIKLQKAIMFFRTVKYRVERYSDTVQPQADLVLR